jgi:DNA-binding NarL/FixJ family response regulator
MIVAAVEDLLFSSKIRNVARRLEVEVVFARSPDAVLSEVRARRPSLVVFDLDAERTEPIDTLAQVKADPQLAVTKAIAFASHVHAGLMAAARQAGADEVMPRSAFVATLPEIVAGAK